MASQRVEVADLRVGASLQLLQAHLTEQELAQQRLQALTAGPSSQQPASQASADGQDPGSSAILAPGRQPGSVRGNLTHEQVCALTRLLSLILKC